MPYRTYGITLFAGRLPALVITALPGGKSSDPGDYTFAFFENLRTASSMDRTVNTTSAQKSRIGGVHYCIDGLKGYIPLDASEFGFADEEFHGEMIAVSEG